MLCSRSREERAEPDAVVRDPRLFAEHDDLPRREAVAFDHGLDELVADHAVAHDHERPPSKVHAINPTGSAFPLHCPSVNGGEQSRSFVREACE